MKTSPIRRILVPLDPSKYTNAATLRACEVAKAHDASISGLAVLDLPGIRATVAPADIVYWHIVGDTVRTATEHAKAKIGHLHKRFGQTCEENGVKYTESDLEGVPSDMILDASMLYDLVVMGLRTHFNFETEEEAGDSLEKVLGRTTSPILAVPVIQSPDPFKSVLIAYDGSHNSARALRDFVVFASPYEFDITVATADKDEAHAKSLNEHAAGYLEAHGYSGFKSEIILQNTLPISLVDDVDLVVAGVHSKRFLKDIFVGSFAKELIERGDTALFLSQ